MESSGLSQLRLLPDAIPLMSPSSVAVCRHSPCSSPSFDRGRGRLFRRASLLEDRGSILLAAIDPSMQTVILTAGAITATSFSLFFGLKGDPVLCAKCGGNGGTKCVFCAESIIDTEGGKAACRVCKGAGLVICKICKGSGYSSRI